MGVLVVLVMARSGCTVVALWPMLRQSLLVLGSPSNGGNARPGLAPAGTLLPTHMVLRTVPATSARVTTVTRRNWSMSRPAALGCSHTTTGAALPSQVQPAPEKLTKLSPLSTSTMRSGPVARRGPLLATKSSLVISEPTATGLGVLLFSPRRSAPSRRTVTDTLPLLLPVFGSLDVAVMLAVLVKLWPAGAMSGLAGAVATTVMSSVAPTASVARVQLTVPASAEQAQPGPLADTKVQPAGSGSVTTTPVAAAGPPLRGWIKKVTLLPAVAGTGEVTVFCAMRTSAPGSTVVSTVAVLLLLSGSAVPPTVAGASVAVLVTVPPLAVTVPTMVTGGMAAPTACGPARSQRTTPALWLHTQPEPLAETKFTDGGRLSVRVMLDESLGPLLLAVSV